MKKKSFAATAVALAMAAITVFTVGNTLSVKAADETDKPEIDFVVEGNYVEKNIASSDAADIVTQMGYEHFDENNLVVCEGKTTSYINWDNSSTPFERVCDTYVFCPILSRDENGNLVIAKDESGKVKAKNNSWGHIGWDADKRKIPAVLSSTSFSIVSKEESAGYSYAYINENLENPPLENVDVTDVYIIRVVYTTDDGPNYTAAWLDYAGIYTDEDRLKRKFG